METAAKPDFKGTTRFTIDRRIGAGGFGVVYQAYDHERNTKVALKTLNQSEAEALYRFKREFRALADVTHPNLVALYELLSEEDQWFFTMELVEGCNFLDYVRDENLPLTAVSTFRNPVRNDEAETIKAKSNANTRDNNEDIVTMITGTSGANGAISTPRTVIASEPILACGSNLTRLRAALSQLVQGVQALHEAGKLHRDIKPSNVMVTPEGRVVILDFGLVAELGAGFHRSMDIVGTPAYMSPEQGDSQIVTAASDWYSVGVILYEALTGRPPFTSKFPQIIHEKLNYDPLPPSALSSGIPEDLDHLCRDLLRRNPAERLQGAALLERLEIRTGSISSPQHAGHFCGREQELGTLAQAFQRVKQGATSTIFISGAAGLGKSALVRHFLDALRTEKNVLTLAGRCYERESVPYKALDSLIDALSQYLRTLPDADKLMPDDVQALARLFPVIRQVDAVAHASQEVLEIPDSHQLRRRAFNALKQLLINLGAARHLVLFIDDLQWGDADSAQLLAELLRAPMPRMMLIGCYRSEEAAHSPLLKALLPVASPTELTLDALTATESLQLAMVLLGGNALLAEAIARESQGSPFFIDELVRFAKSNDERIESGARASLDAAFRLRAERLPDEARRLLEIVAVAGKPIRLVTAREAAGLESDELNAVEILRKSFLARTRGISGDDKIETYHDRIRDTVIASIPAATLRKRHEEIALALQSSDRPDPEDLACHYHGAGQHKQAARFYMEAAHKAESALAFDHAARLYRLALEAGEASTTPLESSQLNTALLKIRLGDALRNAGRGAEAAEIYLESAKIVAAREALDLERRAAEQYLISGHFDAGLAVLGKVLGKVGLSMPASPRRALFSLLLKRAHLAIRGFNFTERAEADVPADLLLRIDTCWSTAMGLGMIDTIRGADFQTRNLLLALSAGEPYRVARALTVEAVYSMIGGGRTRERTEKLLARAAALTEKIDHPHALGIMRASMALSAFYLGQWQRCRELYAISEKILRERCTGVTWELDTSYFFTLRSIFYLGGIDEIIRMYPALLEDARARGDLYAETYLRVRTAYICHLAADNTEAARYELDDAIRKWSRKGFHLQHYFALSGQIDIHLYSNEGAAAWQRINEYWPRIVRSLLMRTQITLIETHYMRARGALAAAQRADARDKLLKQVERDAQRIEREGMDWSNPIVYLLRASIASFQGHKERVITLLKYAAQGFDYAGMALYAAVARYRLGQLEGNGELRQTAAEWMSKQQIKKPARFADMLAPGNFTTETQRD